MTVKSDRKAFAALVDELGLAYEPDAGDGVGRLVGRLEGRDVTITPDAPDKLTVTLARPMSIFLDTFDRGQGAMGNREPFFFGDRMVDGFFPTCLATDELSARLRAVDLADLRATIRGLHRRFDRLVVDRGTIRAAPRGCLNPGGQARRLKVGQVRTLLPRLLALGRSLEALDFPSAAEQKVRDVERGRADHERVLEIGLPRPARLHEIPAILLGLTGIGVFELIYGWRQIELDLNFRIGVGIGALVVTALLVFYFRLRRWSRRNPRVRFHREFVEIPPLGPFHAGLTLHYSDLRSIEILQLPGGRYRAELATSAGTQVLKRTYLGTTFDRIVGELGSRARLRKTGNDEWRRP